MPRQKILRPKRYRYFEVETVTNGKIHICENGCKSAAVWDIRWTYELGGEEDLSGIGSVPMHPSGDRLGDGRRPALTHRRF